jgi:hypothetical protein
MTRGELERDVLEQGLVAERLCQVDHRDHGAGRIACLPTDPGGWSPIPLRKVRIENTQGIHLIVLEASPAPPSTLASVVKSKAQ